VVRARSERIGQVHRHAVVAALGGHVPRDGDFLVLRIPERHREAGFQFLAARDLALPRHEKGRMNIRVERIGGEGGLLDDDGND
jgi:hypothetical protein